MYCYLPPALLPLELRFHLQAQIASCGAVHEATVSSHVFMKQHQPTRLLELLLPPNAAPGPAALPLPEEPANGPAALIPMAVAVLPQRLLLKRRSVAEMSHPRAMGLHFPHVGLLHRIHSTGCSLPPPEPEDPAPLPARRRADASAAAARAPVDALVAVVDEKSEVEACALSAH